MKPIKMNKLPTSAIRPGVAPNEEPVEGAHRATGAGSSLGDDDNMIPDPEVHEKKSRRYFTASYKLRILQKADLCTESGQIGKLLRREGLYSSHLTNWRRVLEKGLLQALTPPKKGTIWSDEEFRIYGIDPAKGSPVYQDMLQNNIHPARWNSPHCSRYCPPIF